MTTQQVPQHPVIACAERVESVLDRVADVEAVYLTTAQKREALIRLARAEAKLTELRLRVLAAADDVAEEAGARDPGAWLAQVTRGDRRAAFGEVRLARALDEKYAKVAEGMRTGVINQAQARVIVNALDKLPPETEPFTRRRAEQHLVELAKDFDPNELRRLGDHILEVVAPEAADELLAKALEREEQRARIKTSLRMRRQGDGTTRITALVPDATAARLETYLDAYTSPRQHDASAELLPRRRRLGQAFCALLEHLDPAQLPDHGGDATTVIVTIDHDKLTKELATAGLIGGIDGDLTITATEARRLACTAKILPAVLNGKGEVLDLGRSQRLFNAPQRRALALRDKHCRAEGCGIPARWTEAHHVKPWSRGGKTDVNDGVLLCSFHHHQAHDPRFDREILPSGDWRFHRRT